MRPFTTKVCDMKNMKFASSVHQEEDVLPPRLLVYIILGVIFISLVLVALAFGILRSSERALRPDGQFTEQSLGPIVERSNVYEDLFGQAGNGQMMAREQRRALSEYTWLDREKRIVGVPIAVAVDLYILSEVP